MVNMATDTRHAAEVEPKSLHRKRRTKPYPSIAFPDALIIGKGVMKFGGGKSIKRLTLMEKLERSPTSGPTRSLITDSGKYGITEGSFKAETLVLTKDGRTVCDENSTAREILRASFRLAIDAIPSFKSLYDKYVNGRMPSREALRDTLEEVGTDVHPEDRMECVDLFVVNAKSFGLIRAIAGAETLVSLDTRLDQLPATQRDPSPTRASNLQRPESIPSDGTRACPLKM